MQISAYNKNAMQIFSISHHIVLIKYYSNTTGHFYKIGTVVQDSLFNVQYTLLP